MSVVELEQVVQEAEQDGLVILAPEDPLEHEVGLEVGEDRAGHRYGCSRDLGDAHVWEIARATRMPSSAAETMPPA